MSTNVKASEQLAFGGVSTSGNPAQRPRNTAEVCEDFRVMPGNYLRLRSGRVPRGAVAPGTIQQIGTCRVPDYWGECYGQDSHLVQVLLPGGMPAWEWMLVNVPGPGQPGPSYTIIDPANRVEAIATANDAGFGVTHPVAFANLSNHPVFYNGQGVRDIVRSTPPLSTFPRFDAEVQHSARYFGLDCYVPSGTPPITTFTAGSGGLNKWLTGLSLYVGLWSKPYDHYSNGVISMHMRFTQTAPGTLTMSNLNNLTYPTHGADETAELYYVFYATIDGGQVPYLILNGTLDGPLAVPVTATNVSLSIDPRFDCGFALDLTHEMPIENYPPRPMRSIAYVNGRMYGVLMKGGVDTPGFGFHPPVFSYVPLARDYPAVVWSAAAGDNLGSDFLGDPLQSWPLTNISYTPSGEQPLIVTASSDGVSVLVITSTSTFFLQETADGIHEWVTISRVHGIGNPATLKNTKHGIVWVTQRNQIVMLGPDSNEALRLGVLSDDYQSLMVGKPRCADYIVDPAALLDRYQVWMDTGKSVCHDFATGAYTASNQDFTTAFTTVDKAGLVHHIVAKNAFYTHETQPEGGIPVTDAGVEILGKYTRNWDDFGDCDVRKEMPMVDLIGDGAPAAPLNASPLTVEWYGDFETLNDTNKKYALGERVVQSTTNPTFRYKLAAANKFWYKLVFKLRGHSSDIGGPTSNYSDPSTEGNGPNNFYGMILRALWRLGVSENRA
jgi:hypothetical protein